MKKLILLTCIVSSIFADTNESKIFLDKYRDGIGKYKKEIIINQYDASDVSACKLSKDINISSDITNDAKSITNNILIDKAMETKANEDAKVIHTENFKKKLQEAKDNLLYDKKLGWTDQAVIAKKYLAQASEKGEQNVYFNSKETVYIFVSSSMEKKTLLNYLESTKYIQNNVVFVLQGAIGGMKKLKPTMLWIKDLIGEKYASAGFMIDPRLAKNFKIKEVPAILYTQKELFELEAEKITNNSKSSGDTYLFYGDMPFRYAIKELNEKKQNQFLTDILRKLDTK